MMSEPTAHPALLGVTQSLLGREWRLRGSGADRIVCGLSQQYDLSDPVARILAARGYTQDNTERFLNISLRDHLPAEPIKAFKDMDKAVARLLWAIRHDEPIVVYADYDCDGATSGALVRLYLRALGIQTVSYIPDRLRDGYGGGRTSIDEVRAMLDSRGAGPGRGLCIMLDCNSRAFDLLAYAQQRGVTVIIGDHHKTEGELPHAEAIVNPMRWDDDSASNVLVKDLVSVGIAFMMMGALNSALRDEGYFTSSRPAPDMRDFLDLVAVGTVADVGRLTGLNRTLVARGLEKLQERKNIGLATLLRLSGLDISQRPTAEDIGFRIGPRINAAGRIDRTDLGITLLCTQSELEALELAEQLGAINRARQEINEQMMAEARHQALAQMESGAPVLVVANRAWHPGVVGIVAGRLREEFYRPAFVFGRNPHLEEHLLTGSGRSVEGIDLGEAVISGQIRGLFKGGGHAMAAGATVDGRQLDDFRRYLAETLAREIDRLPPRPLLHCDLVLDAGAVTLDLVRQLDRLEPCGKDNPAPMLGLAGVRLSYVQPMGQQGQHLRCEFSNASGHKVSAVVWNCMDKPHGKALLEGRGSHFHIMGVVSKNSFNGRDSAQFRVEDVAAA